MSIALAVLPGLVACSTLPAQTASVVECNEDDIEISDAQNGPNGDSWTATCRNRVYDCARPEEPVEINGWNWGTDYMRFKGVAKGQTYCIRREPPEKVRAAASPAVSSQKLASP